MNVTEDPSERIKRRSGASERFIAFTLGGEHFAIPLLGVKEVIALTQITPVPQAPAYFRGILDLRGQIISVIDLRTKLGLKSQSESSETSILILDLGSLQLGAIVDSVESVVSPEVADVKAPPAIECAIDQRYVTGVLTLQKKLVLLLDIEKALSSADLRLMQEGTRAVA